jgi:hypothetical protein
MCEHPSSVEFGSDRELILAAAAEIDRLQNVDRERKKDADFWQARANVAEERLRAAPPAASASEPVAYLFTIRDRKPTSVKCTTFAAIDYTILADEDITVLNKVPLYAASPSVAPQDERATQWAFLSAQKIALLELIVAIDSGDPVGKLSLQSRIAEIDEEMAALSPDSGGTK